MTDADNANALRPPRPKPEAETVSRSYGEADRQTIAYAMPDCWHRHNERSPWFHVTWNGAATR